MVNAKDHKWELWLVHNEIEEAVCLHHTGPVSSAHLSLAN
jgi:hypothetical protein